MGFLKHQQRGSRPTTSGDSKSIFCLMSQSRTSGHFGDWPSGVLKNSQKHHGHGHKNSSIHVVKYRYTSPMDPTKPYTWPQICQSIRRTQSLGSIYFTKVHQLEPPATSKHQLKEIHLGDPPKNSCLSPGDLRGSCVSSPFFGVFFFFLRGTGGFKDFLNFSSRTPWGCDPIGRTRILFQMGGEKNHQLEKHLSALPSP